MTRPAGYGAGKTGEPAFRLRGVVEGFYGRPWTREQRLDVVRFIAARGMNTFVYAPKDDPLVRRDWREPYTGAALAELAELVAECARNGIDLVYCLSPGLSIRYSDTADAAALSAKFESVAALGVGSFGLLLDDIPVTLQHEADIAVFPDLVAAHIALVGRVFDDLLVADHDRRLVVCPTDYFGYGDEEYIRRLGSGVDPRIEIFWTGRAICSATIDLHDAEVFTEAAHRTPLYWDNYPVNDVAMTHELHIGPYRGRDRRLATASAGIIANGMPYVESSKIAFATIADYLWSPEDYDPEESWSVALADVVGSDADLAAYTLFADTVRSSCLSPFDAPRITAGLERFAFANEIGEVRRGAEELRALAAEHIAAAEHLLGDGPRNRALVAEARPWIETFLAGAEALERMAELAGQGRLDSEGACELEPYRTRFLASRLRVFGDAVSMALADIVEPITPRGTPANQPPLRTTR